MIKTIMPGDYDWSDQQAVLFDVGSRGLDRDQMQKRAAAGIFNDVDIQAKPGRSVIHLIALGDAERYGPNRNADFFYGAPREIEFPEPRGTLKSIKLATGNIERAWTFEKYARVYRDHCFPPGTPVLMADGTYKAIESVVIGDSVISGAGVPRRVVRTYIHDSPKNLISFDVAGSRQPILCTDEHPFGVVRGDHTLCRKLGYAAANRCYPHTAGTRGVCQSRGCSGNGCDMSPEWMEARNVRHGDYFLVPRETSTPADSFFDGADAAYFLGLFLAEGGFSHGLLRKDSLATLTFCGDERHLADAAVAFLSRKGWRFRGPYGPYAKSNTLTIEIVGASAVSELRRLSGGLAYSHEKTVPPGLYGCSSEMRLAFLGGYMDGDGSWSDVKHVLRGRTVSFDGLQGLWRLAASVGIPAYMCCDGQSYVMRNKAVQKDYVCRPSGVLAIYGAWTRALQPYCFKLAHVDFDAIRRSGNSLVLPSFVGFPITRIAEVPATAATVHNLEVEVDNSYIVNGFAVHNCNKKTDKAYGDVLKAAHNHAMARTELLIDVPNDDPVWRDDIEKVASGDSIFFSMSCKVPGDFCSICGNFSKSRKAKDGGTDCRHIKHQLSCLSRSGHRVGMINDHMVFFDISRVRVPADRIAYSLLKVAGYGDVDLSDELPFHRFDVPHIDAQDDPFGVYVSKLSEVLHKLSNIEKQIEAVGRAPNESLSFDPSVMRQLSDDERRTMGQSRGDIGKVLAALADKKICLSLPDFVKLVLGERAGGYENSIQLASDSLPGVFSRLAEEGEDENDLPESAMDEGEAAVPRRVSEMIEAMKGGMSLDDEPVARRVTIVAIRKLPAPDLKKAASVYDETADKMLRAYAAYKVAWCLRNGIDSRVTKLAVLQHYVGSN